MSGTDERTSAAESDVRRLQAMLQQAPTRLLVVDGDGVITLANDALLASLGLTRDELVGVHCHELAEAYITPDGRTLPLPELPSSVARRGEQFDGELEIVQANGHRQWVHVSAGPIRDEQGLVTGAIVSSRDISADREARAALVASEAWNRALLDAIPDSLYVNTRDGVIVAFKPPRDGRPMLRMPRIGQRSGEIWPGPTARMIEQAIRDTLDSGTSMTMEYQVPTPEGSGYREARVVPMGDDRVLALIRDIDARKRAEEERERLVGVLDAERRRLDAILRQVPNALLVLNKDGIIVDVNDGLAATIGVPKSALIGKRSGEVGRTYFDTSGHPLARHELPSNRALLGEETECELRVLAADGRESWLYVSAAPVRDDRGDVVGAIVATRDVTAERAATLALQRLNQELEARVEARTAQLNLANRELEAFSYSVSHDLKAPLRGIDGYSRLLWEEQGDRLDDDGRELLENVRRGAAQMHQLIDDLLAYSRLERRAVDAAEVDLLPIVQALVAERADEIARRAVKVTVSVPDLAARIDREGFAQAIRNLLDNALRFTRDVQHPRIEIGGEDSSSGCTLWVKDNGIGFDMAYHDRIFEIFQRLHREEEFPGTGIGLALVRKAMQRMGGRVWAESAPGVGATFLLELPR